MLFKCCTQYASKFGKLSSGHKTGKGQLSFQSQWKAMPKMLKLPHNCTHFTYKQMLKIFQARLQHYVNQELPDVQAGFRKSRGTRDQIANSCWIIEKEREFQKTSISALLTMPNPLTVWITINCGKFWRWWDYKPPELPLEKPICRSGSTVRTGHGTTDWFQIGKGVRQGCILSPGLFNFFAEYIMQNAGPDEAQAGSRLLGEISVTSDMQMTPPLWQKPRGIKEPLESERGKWKNWLKTQHSEN